jgi:hypothetical protein
MHNRFPGIAFVLGCAAAIGGCGGLAGWDVSAPPGTGVSPEAGEYSFTQQGCFSVVQEPQTGDKHVRFSSDCYRFDRIPIRNGRFERAWGQIGGTHCPSDSYKIAGVFETPTRARGEIQYAYACRTTGPSVAFIARRR